MKTLGRSFLSIALAAGTTAAQAEPAASQTRGELLYSNHCVECHTSQMHWRDRRQARDWPSLRAQVQRWQAAANLQWNEADVTEVARYLDNTIYHFAPEEQRVGSVAGGEARISGVGSKH
jgi:mono/diheme cytochrome c family protein